MELLSGIKPAMIILTASVVWGYGRYYPLEVLKIYVEFKVSGRTEFSVRL